MKLTTGYHGPERPEVTAAVEKLKRQFFARYVKRSDLNRLVRESPRSVPASIRVGKWSFEWTGKGWLRGRARDTDVIIIEGC